MGRQTQTNNLNSMNMSELDDLIVGYRASTDSNTMIKMAHRMEEIIHDDASVVRISNTFYRVGYWRWRHYPDDFNLMISEFERVCFELDGRGGKEKNSQSIAI